jgi:hypothetical protein
MGRPKFKLHKFIHSGVMPLFTLTVVGGHQCPIDIFLHFV